MVKSCLTYVLAIALFIGACWVYWPLFAPCIDACRCGNGCRCNKPAPSTPSVSFVGEWTGAVIAQNEQTHENQVVRVFHDCDNDTYQLVYLNDGTEIAEGFGMVVDGILHVNYRGLRPFGGVGEARYWMDGDWVRGTFTYIFPGHESQGREVYQRVLRNHCSTT